MGAVRFWVLDFWSSSVFIGRWSSRCRTAYYWGSPDFQHCFAISSTTCGISAIRWISARQTDRFPAIDRTVLRRKFGPTIGTASSSHTGRVPEAFFLPYCMFSFSGSHDSPKQTHFYSVSLRWFVGRFVLATGVNGDWQFAARYHIWLRVFMSFKASGSWLPVRSRVVAPSVSISLYICFMHVLEKSRPPLVCWTPLSYLSTIFHDSYSYTEFPTAPVVTQSDQDCASLRVKQSG